MVAADDVLQINIGGTIVTTKRRTLMQVETIIFPASGLLSLSTVTLSTYFQAPGSFLDCMFSGRWPEESLARDDSDRPFLDLNPDIVVPLINYLRVRGLNEAAFTAVFITILLLITIGREVRVSVDVQQSIKFAFVLL